MSCFSNNQEQILEKYQDFSLPSYVRTILSVYSWQHVSLLCSIRSRNHSTKEVYNGQEGSALCQNK